MRSQLTPLYLAQLAAAALRRLAPGWVLPLWRCRQAAIAPLTALMLVPISGALAFAVELGSWQYMQRSMQNAADSAAIAAATVDSASPGANTGTTTSFLEASAAAAKFGYVAGTNNVTFKLEDTVANAATFSCPTGVPAGSTCYRATISTTFPLLFSRVIGFTGSSQQIVSRAVATTNGGNVIKDVCVWAKSTDSDAFDSKGGPKPDMSGCNLVANGGMNCAGHNLGATAGYALGGNGIKGGTCGKQTPPPTMTTAPIDPYAKFANNIPANPCKSYSSTSISGTQASKTFCGNVKLTGDVTITGKETVIVIENGTLDLNGKTLKTDADASVTVVFSGSSTSDNYITNSSPKASVLDIQAPTSTTATWSGVAIYQDPNIIPDGNPPVKLLYTGNDPAWNISGLVYLPDTITDFRGIVNKASNGDSCFVLVSWKVWVSGTAKIFDNTGCTTSGVDDTLSLGGGKVVRLVQ